MLNFNFNLPTQLHFGKGVENNVGTIVKSFDDYKNILIVYGSNRIESSGLLPNVENELQKLGCNTYRLQGVKPNPKLSLVYEGIELAKKNDVDFVLAIGGGSPIDTAKAIAVGATVDDDIWNYFEGKEIKTALPIGCILTIPAAGSEASISSIITKEEGNLKRGINSKIILPKFAIMNPELTMTLPKYQVACGVTDMLAHVMERYFTNTQHVVLSDAMSEAIMRTIIHEGKKTYNDPTDYDARAEIMLAGTMAHNGLLDIGRADDWASHRIAAEMGGLYDTAHGATLSIIIPHWMEYVLEHDLDRMVQFAHNVMGAPLIGSQKEIAKDGIARLVDFYQQLNMPVSFSDANIPSDRLEEMAKKATANNTCTVGNYVKLQAEDIVEIYKLSL